MDPNEKTKPQQDTEEQSQVGQEQSDTTNKGFFNEKGVASSTLGKTTYGRGIKLAINAVGRHKGKAGIGAAILGVILSLVLVAFFGLKSFELVHMMKIFQNYAFVASEYTEGSRTSRLLGRSLQNGRNMDPDRARMEGNQRRTGRLIGDWVNDNRLDRLESQLKKDGYELEYKGDQNNPRKRVATAIRRPNGDTIELNKFRQSRKEVRNLIKKRIPAYRVGKRFRYYRLMNYRTGWNRKFFAGRGARNAAQRLRGRVRGESEVQRVRSGDTEVSEEERTRANQELNEQRNEMNNMVENARQGRSINVRAAGVGVSVTGLVMMKCLAENIGESTEGRERARYEAPMALDQEMSTAADQSKVGGATVTSEQYGQTMGVFHDPATENTSGKHWDETASYKRASGIRTTGNEPDLEDDYFTPSGGVGSVIRTVVNGFISVINSTFSFGQGFCSAVGNTGVQLAADTVEFILSAGVGKAIAIGIEWTGDITGGTEYVLRHVISFLAGNINCMQFDTSAHLAANCLSAGTVLNNTEHVRSNFGAPPLPEEEYNNVRDKAEESQHEALAQKSLFYRYLSPDNSYSITTQMAIALPKTPEETMRKTANIPSSLVKSLGNIFMQPVDAQWEKGNEYETYGLEKFGFTEEEIYSIDPMENESKIVNGYLRYYCWEENGNHYQTPGKPGCNHNRAETASHMREYLYCTQLPYNPSERENDNWRDNDQCQKYRRNSGPLSGSIDGNTAVVRTGMWLFDRYTVENLSQLVAEDNLDDEVTFVLLDNIEECAERNGEKPGDHGENDPGNPCYVPQTNEQSIFHSKGYIEGERIRPAGSTTNEEEESDDSAPISDGSLQYPSNLSRGGCPEPYYRMPESTDGKYAIDARQSRRCGKKELIGVLYTTALNYYDKRGPGSKLHIGDLNGGAPHESHKWGIAADLDAASNPRAGDHTKGNYNTNATVDLGNMLVDTGLIKNIWWCDPGDGSTKAIREYAQSQGAPINIKCISGHENHFHIDIKGSRGPVHAP